MGRNKIYDELEGYWVYTHTTPDGMVYAGMSGYSKANLRWVESHYRTNTVFGGEIRRWGWDKISHEVLCDGLTREEAKALEGEIIDFCKANVVSLNEYRSGGVCDNRREYYERNSRWLNEWYRYNHLHRKVVEESERNDEPLW